MIAALFAVAWADCPPLGPLVERLHQDLEEVRLDATTADLERIGRAIACGPVVEPRLAARLHGLVGVRATLLGEADTAAASWVTARRLDPSLDLGAFGPSIARASSAIEPAEPVPLQVRPPIHAPWTVWIDGEPASDTVVPGAHVVQVLDGDGRTRFGAMTLARGGRPFAVLTGLAPEEAPAPPPRVVAEPLPRAPVQKAARIGAVMPLPEEIAPSRRRRGLAWGGAAVTTAGLGLLGYSFERAAAMGTAPDARTLQRRWDAHRAARLGGIGFAGLGAVLVVVGSR